jgi:hypothetical protein
MAESGIVTFEHPELGSACDELEALGLDFVERVLLHLRDVYSGKIKYRTLATFDSYLGIEMFDARIGNKFVVFSVETDEMDDLKISILFAGEHGVAVRAGALSWDGANYAALKAGIVKARAIVWFD